jgi:hypothetical protein
MVNTGGGHGTKKERINGSGKVIKSKEHSD